MAYPPAQAAPQTTIGAPMAPPAYTTPSGIPALPRPALQLSADDVSKWWGRIQKDRARRELELPRWRTLAKAYFPPNVGSDYTDLNSNIHFRNVSLKTAELWTQCPDLALEPLDTLKDIPELGPDGNPIPNPQNPQQFQMASPDDIVAIRRALLNKELGREGTKASQMVKRCLFDYQMTSGIGPSKICYEADVKTIPDEPQTPVPGAILGLSQPPPQRPVVVNERRRWYHFSAEKLLIPVGFDSTDWDQAPYLGMEFELPDTPQNREAYKLPADFQSTSVRNNDRALTTDQDRSATNSEKVIKGIEIWLHAAEFDQNEADRDVFYRLVLIEGVKDRAVIYELSPYQDKGLNGRLTSDSMIGNPIHPLCLRVSSDTAWVPSDAAFTNPLVNIENIAEKRDALRSEANIARFIHAASLTSAIDKLKEAGTGQGAAVDDALMARGRDALIWELPHLETAQSDNVAREHNRQAITETLGLGANQAGAYNNTRKSATESAIVAESVSARLQGERQELLDWFVSGVTKFATLQSRFMTDDGIVQIVGRDGLRKVAAFNRAHLAPRFAFNAYADSQLTIDQATRIKRETDFVNFFAKSPAMDQVQLARGGCEAFGKNASDYVRPPAPPPPEKPNISYNFKGEDLAIPEVRAILGIANPQLAQMFAGAPSPEAVAAKQQADAKAVTHGGQQPHADTVSKHAAQETDNQVGRPPLAGLPAKTPETMQPGAH